MYRAKTNTSSLKLQIYELTISYSPALRRAAPVVRDRCDVADGLHLDADGLQGANRGFASGAGPLHLYVDRPQPIGLRGVARVDGGLRCRKGRPLPRSLEADAAGARPGNHVPLGIGDRDVRVVERGVDVHVAMMDDALLAALLEGLPRRLLPAFFFLGCYWCSV